jgi:ABC-2 type transport system ATP-binding protein
MIQVKQVSKTFHASQTRPVLNQAQLTIPKGSIYGLLGSNGAGKTTLLKMIVGIYRPSMGTIEINGQAVFENIAVKQSMVYIPNELYFFPQSTIRQMAQFYKGFFPAWDDQRFASLEAVFNIPTNKKINTLSKGMQRQVAFWLALACKPQYLILDEPLDGLDAIMRGNIKNLLFQEVAERGLSVLLTSHNLREIEDMCDHIGILHQGNMIIEQDLDDLKTEMHKWQIAFDSPEQVESFKAKLNVLHVEERGKLHSLIIKGKPESVEEVIAAFNPAFYDRLPLTLEEIFTSVLGGNGYEISDLFI